MHNHTTRRRFLQAAFFGSSMIGLRSMASGIPVHILADPQRFLAAPAQKDASAYMPQFLLLASSDGGEPMNTNMPGMYANKDFVHPTADSMKATNFSLGGQAVTAALPWSTLPSLNRTCFFHHATQANQHGSIASVHALQGSARRGTMLVSSLGEYLHPLLGTIQPEPINLDTGGNEVIFYENRPLPSFGAQTLKEFLGTPDVMVALQGMQTFRDRDLGALNALARAQGTPAHQALIDRWATNQQQARQIPADIINTLNNINNNNLGSSLTAAIALFKARITPVVNVHLPFGGDSHSDPGLASETYSTGASVASINTFLQGLSAAGMADNVTFATLNVFGRSNTVGTGAGTGRDHNGQHSCNVMIGKNIRPCVVGGAVLDGPNAAATAFDSVTGAGGSGGNISPNLSLASYGATLAQATGITAEAMAASLSSVATPVKAALA